MLLDTTFLGSAKIATSDRRFLGLLRNALAKIPPDATPLCTLRQVSLKRRGELPGLVGLTRWGQLSHEEGGKAGRATAAGSQTITFYTELLSQLSESASVGVMVHELAHAWLNEHLLPEDSAAREGEADELARKWGFEKELAALEQETEPF
ncbi:MAG: hypothetical protein ABSG45_00415 [Nitrososphaerales archaeon]|jgi:hypothetical protein